MTEHVRGFARAHPVRSWTAAVALTVAMMLLAAYSNGTGVALMVLVVAIPGWLFIFSPHMLPAVITWAFATIILSPVGAATTIVSTGRINAAPDGMLMWAALMGIVLVLALRYSGGGAAAFTVALAAGTAAATGILGVLIWAPAGFAWTLPGAVTVAAIRTRKSKRTLSIQISAPPDSALGEWAPVDGHPDVWEIVTAKTHIIAVSLRTRRTMSFHPTRGLHVGHASLALVFNYFSGIPRTPGTIRAVIVRAGGPGAVRTYTDDSDEEYAWVGTVHGMDRWVPDLQRSRRAFKSRPVTKT